MILGTQTFYYTLDADGTGNVGLDNFTITDPLPVNFALSSIRMPTVNNGPGGNFIVVKYRRSDTGATEYTWGTTHPASTSTTLNVSALGLGAGVYISQVRFEGSRRLEFQHRHSAPPQWHRGSHPAGMRPVPLITTGSQVCNTMTFTADYNGSLRLHAQDFAELRHRHPAPTVRPTAAGTVVSGNPVIPGGTTTWQVVLSNPFIVRHPHGQSERHGPAADVVGVRGRVFPPGRPAPLAGVTAPTLEAIVNYNGTGRTLLRWSYAYSFAIGNSATVQFQTRVKPCAWPRVTSTTGAMFRWTPPPKPGRSSMPTVPKPTRTTWTGMAAPPTSAGAAADVATVVSSTASLDSYKLVKGQLDSDWHKYPESGLDQPRGHRRLPVGGEEHR